MERRRESERSLGSELGKGIVTLTVEGLVPIVWCFFFNYIMKRDGRWSMEAWSH